MALNSDTISFLRHSVHIKFHKEARGYSKEQVQRTLAKLPPLADEVERLQNRLIDYETRAQAAEARLVEAQAPAEVQTLAAPPVSEDFSETLRNTMVSAQRTADTTVREAQEEAERLRTEAEFQSNSLLAETRDQVNEMTREAEAAKAEMIAEAEAERAKMLEDASSEVKERLAKIEAELEEAHDTERANLMSQISELQDTHKLLQTDVTRFEEHLESRREDVRKALNEITEVLDDPDRLRVEEPIQPAEVPGFEPEDYPPISVNSDSVEELEQEAVIASEATAPPEETIDISEFDSLNVVVEDEDDDAVDVYIDDDYLVDGEAEGLEQEAYVEDDQGDQADYLVDIETEEGADDDGSGRLTPPPPPMSSDGGDPYLEELRRVTTEEPTADDAISSFLDDDQSKAGGGWFGRKK